MIPCCLDLKTKQDVFDLLLRFRSDPVALVADRSDGNVLTSHHGKAIKTVLPLPVEWVSPLETSESL